MVKFKWEKEFKDTAFGKIPKDWEVSFLGDKTKFEIIMGQSPPSKYYNKEGKGMPFAQGKKEFGELYINPTIFTTQCSKIAPPNSVLITVRAPVGELNLTKSELCIGRGIAAILDKSGNPLRNRFIFYALKGLSEYLSMLGQRGTTYESITKEELDVISIPYPHSFEQECIASVLSWFDDLIENKRRQNEVLEKVAMAVFKSWFVDFEPFRDGEFVPSELGEIPKGWTVKPIGELAEIRNGLSYSGKEKFEEPVEGSYIFITLNNAIEGGGFKPVYAWIKSDRIKEHHFLEEGDLIIPNTEQTKDERLLGSPGIVFFPPEYKGTKGVYSHHITKIRPFEQKHKLFLYLFLRFTREDSASFATGTGVLGMDIDNFRRNKLIIIPPKQVMDDFNTLVEPFFRKIIINQKEIMVLKKVRDTLLPLLVFGKLRVEEL